LENVVVELIGWLSTIAEAISTLLIGVGIIHAAFLAVVFAVQSRSRAAASTFKPIETIRFKLGRWLALALEFQLAADILKTAVAPTWDDIGKVAAIMALRTALNFFLEREIAGVERQLEGPNLKREC
jgi:uncharacterized membrane protein